MIGKKTPADVCNIDVVDIAIEGYAANFQDLKSEVDNGRIGKNKGVPMGFDRLNHYITLRKKLFFLIGGLTGSGKTSFVDDAFVLNPIDWVLSDKNTKNQKINIIYRSMERSKSYKLAKWVCRKIFLDTGKLLPLGNLMGWTGKLDDDDYELFLSYQPYIDNLSKMVTIIDGAENPIGIANGIKKYALEHGKIVKIDEFESKYIPDDPSLITIIIIDHIGLLKSTKDLPTKKQRIDKMSDELRYARDFYGFTPVVVSQFNREIANIMRIKNGDVEPQLEDFKDSSSTQDDADVVLALFDPMRYKVEDPSRYDLSKLRDQFGAKYFRSLRLIKNSYGEDDVRVGLGFLGQIGMFKELPKLKDMTPQIYEDIVDKSFFMNQEDDGTY
jgi:DnaB-like helicase C terminal domain